MRIPAVAAAVLGAALLVPPPSAVPAEFPSKSLVLDNGLKVWLVEKRNCPLVNVVVAVNVGVKDETADTRGLVHALEHCILFRGTGLRSGGRVGRETREHGAYFNAHTGEDLAFFEISVPAAATEFALANQREIVFDLKISQEELDAEKDILLEELNQVEDDPFRYGTSLAYQRLFSGHPYGNPIYGDREGIKALRADKLETFYRTYFVPANCSLAVVGDFALNDIEEKVRRVFGAVKGTPFVAPRYAAAPPLAKGVDLRVEMDVQKSYLVIAFPAPGFNHQDQGAVDLLTEIMGRGLNPMLYSALSGRSRRIAESLSMGYQAHRYGGAALIYITLDAADMAAAKRETTAFLKRAREENFSKEDTFGDEQLRAFDYLGGAKNQIRYRACQAQEKGLALASSLAGYLLLTDGEDGGPSYLDRIGKLKSGDLRKAADKYLSRSDFVVISIFPKKRVK